MEVSIRIAGQAGQGLQTIGNLLVGVLSKLGVHVFATQSYMSRIRGGLNWFDIRISDQELFSGCEKADLLVALSPEAIDELLGQVNKNALILYDSKETIDHVISMDFQQAAKDLTGAPVMANTIAAGVIFTILGYNIDSLCDHLQKKLAGKGREIVDDNIKCARHGAEWARDLAGKIKGPDPADAPAAVYNGGQTVALGAATAGVKFATAYPMTPGTATFTYLAGMADEYSIVVEQAEDEIAAVNMICGATYAGVPAITTTSGGGFALMVEGVSLAGMMELPIVIMIAQRPGPATGLPTRTAQQDLKMVLYAGHGEFPRAIYAPGSLKQAYDLTRQAIQTAHTYQSPTFILMDQFLVDVQKNIVPLDHTLNPIDRCIILESQAEYQRYVVTENGVSPRAIPGGEGFVVCDSDEHTEDGHITEDLQARIRFQDKRMAKSQGLLKEAIGPEFYGPSNADLLLVCWGSTYGPCREAVDRLNSSGRSAAMLHFSQVWPIDMNPLKENYFRDNSRRIYFVEGNVTAQLASLLREQGLHLSDYETILRYDGMPFTGQEIAERIERG
ncbi:MAG: 2-oxoacid:acceptor oxidoreductase subunit alpha [Sedimentisphaerales bacterium]|nr:2-oxoacid:acceptor oxidoreductase subunit alpha [Sedimentisphaerales bacterium]